MIAETGPGSPSSQADPNALPDDTRTDLTNVTDVQSKIAAVLEEAQSKLKEIRDVATFALAEKTKIADEQAVIATKSDHIQKAQEHADKVRGDLDRAVTNANQQVTAAEAHTVRAKDAADKTADLHNGTQSTKTAVDTDAAAVTAARKVAETSSEATKALAEKSATIETRIADYEKRLAEIQTECTAQLQNINDLLPGATSVGLAHSFDERRKTFLKPHNSWQYVFIGSVLAIVALAGTGLLKAMGSETILTYDELVRMWLSRLPVAGALVWLALHASRESALAKRLEEDYGYKSVMAASFVGFHKQMLEVGASSSDNQPLAKLCDDTLSTIASPPGRIYDGQDLAVSPTGELAEAAKAIKDVVQKQ